MMARETNRWLLLLGVALVLCAAVLYWFMSGDDAGPWEPTPSEGVNSESAAAPRRVSREAEDTTEPARDVASLPGASGSATSAFEVTLQVVTSQWVPCADLALVVSHDDELLEHRTDAQGLCQFHLEEPAEVEIRVPAYGETRRRRFGADEARYCLVLENSRAFTVRVTDAADVPLADAEVWAGRKPSPIKRLSTHLIGKTDAKGELRVFGLSPSANFVQARHERGLVSFARPYNSAGDGPLLLLKARPTARRILVTVDGIEDLENIPFRLFCGPKHGHFHFPDTGISGLHLPLLSNSDTLLALDPGSDEDWFIDVVQGDQIIWRKQISKYRCTEPELRIHLSLDRMRELPVLVLNDAGEPVAGARVSRTWPEFSRAAVTDIEGRASVRCMTGKKPSWLQAQHDDQGSGRTLIDEHLEDDPLVIRLKRRSANQRQHPEHLIGTIKTSTGMPVSARGITLWAEETGPDRGQSDTTDEFGRFEIRRPLPEGDLHYRMRAATAMRAEHTGMITAAERSSPLHIVVPDPTAEGSTVRFRLGPCGPGPRTRHIFLHGPDEGFLDLEVEPDQRELILRGLVAGRYLAQTYSTRVSRDTWIGVPVGFRVSEDSDLVVELGPDQPLGTLETRGKVRVDVMIDGRAWRSVGDTEHENGHTRTGLPAGYYDVLIHRGGQPEPERGRVRIKAGETLSLD